MAIYLDYAAATPMHSDVLEAMLPYFNERFYNPSALYLQAHDIDKDVREARHSVAQILGCQANELIFTAGGTEADNLAVRGVMSQFTDANVVISGLEHSAIYNLASEFNGRIIDTKLSGVIDLQDLEQKIDDKTVLISVIWASNELGTLQPIRKIANLIKKVRETRKLAGNDLPLYLHSDASQATAWCDLNVNTSGVDMMTINGGKIYGPKQTGLLYVRRGIELAPLIVGGGQERGIRSGSINVAGVIGLVSALKLCHENRAEKSEVIIKLRNNLESQITKAIPATQINGQNAIRLPNFSSLTFDNVDGERLVMELDELGVMAATGAACSANSDEPSRALLASGLSVAQANSTLRLSLGYPTTDAEIEQTAQAIIKCMGKDNV